MPLSPTGDKEGTSGDLTWRRTYAAVTAMSHRQVPVMVRVKVDEGIRPLVEALTRLEGVYTLESCQGTPGSWPAYVLFEADELGEDLFAFLGQRLGLALAGSPEAGSARLSARYDRFSRTAPRPTVTILLEVEPEDIQVWAKRLSELAEEWDRKHVGKHKPA